MFWPAIAGARHGGQPGRIGSLWPAGATPSGALDRRALGRLIFARPAERLWLEALTHPLVKEAFTRDLAWHHQLATVVLVAPPPV